LKSDVFDIENASQCL